MKSLFDLKVQTRFRSMIAIQFFIFILITIFLFNGYGQETQMVASDTSQLGVQANPFKLLEKRIVPGSTFRIHIDTTIFNVKTDKILGVELQYEIPKIAKNYKIEMKNYEYQYENEELYLNLSMPAWDKLINLKKQSNLGGVIKPYKANLLVKYKRTELLQNYFFKVEIPSVGWAINWGIVFVVLSIILVVLLVGDPIKCIDGINDLGCKEWKEKVKCWKKWLLAPLNLAITPIRTYSISMVQIMIWSYITIFGLVYVYCVSGEFLNITAQILILLGIGAGTAVGAKANAVQRTFEIPIKYLKLVDNKRYPKLSNIISIDGKPSIFKYQILCFTIIIGYIVLREMLKSDAFPVIPDNLLALMGISGTVYLGNEVAHENIWGTIEDKIKKIEKKAGDENKPCNKKEEIEALGYSEVDDLENLLKRIYS